MKNRHLLRFQHLHNGARLLLTNNATTSSEISGTEPCSVYFCAHFGTSMNPTLCELDLLEIEPYGNQPVRVGDVIFFVPPDWNRPAIHRVVRANSEGIRTRGDNNTLMDSWVVCPEDVLGRVVRATRGRRRRPIYGGRLGWLWAVGVGAFKILVRGCSFFYHLLAQVGFFRRFFSLRNRMRIISINQTTEKELQLLLGHWLVGRCKPGDRWWIRRPFRLFVDENSLPRNVRLKDVSCRQ